MTNHVTNLQLNNQLICVPLRARCTAFVVYVGFIHSDFLSFNQVDLFTVRAHFDLTLIVCLDWKTKFRISTSFNIKSKITLGRQQHSHCYSGDLTRKLLLLCWQTFLWTRVLVNYNCLKPAATGFTVNLHQMAYLHVNNEVSHFFVSLRCDNDKSCDASTIA